MSSARFGADESGSVPQEAAAGGDEVLLALRRLPPLVPDAGRAQRLRERCRVHTSDATPLASGRFLVSTDGGVRPLWAPSGKELFYVAPAGGIMSVNVADGPSWSASAPAVRVRDGYFTSPGNPGRTYDVSVDGERLLMIKDEQQDAPYRFVVVQHWLDELRRLAPVK